MAELARRSGLSHAGINKVESGEYKHPRLSTLQALADTFEVDLTDLTRTPVERDERPTIADLSILLKEMDLLPADREMVLRFVESLLVMTEAEMKAEAARQLKADNPAFDEFERPAKKASSKARKVKK